MQKSKDPILLAQKLYHFVSDPHLLICELVGTGTSVICTLETLQLTDGPDQCATGYPVPVPVPANPANIFQSGSGSGSGQILAGLAGFLK